MKSNSEIKYLIVLSISYITTLLFIYAATSKVIDFENFQVQLGQSPMLSAFAKYISYGVIISEIGIAFLLITAQYRIVGLILSYCLMVMFTSYIYIILNYSSFIPCSCGGLLEELTWNEHIIFNLTFVFLIILAIILSTFYSSFFQSSRKIIVSIVVLGLISYYSVYLLFLWSENIMQYQNTFIRRFPHHPTEAVKEINLNSTNVYFAGASNDTVFLGDYSAPLKIIAVTPNGIRAINKVKLNQMDFPFTSIQIRVAAPYFYLVDGNVPAIFKGKIEDWNANYMLKGNSYFSSVMAIDSTGLIIRSILKNSKTNTLGKINFNDTSTFKFNPKLIQKQLDGQFDTDGQLHYDRFDNKLVYLYAYRNQFIITDKNLKLLHRGNTIDTISKAHLKVVTVQSNGETKLAAPPLVVNKASALYKNLLFVNSQLPGQFENLKMWEKASIIDVYDINKNSYLLSFYINKSGLKKLKNFYIQGNYLYVLIDDNLVIYELRKSITGNYKK